MENKDLPAYPIIPAFHKDGSQANDSSEGLTKRELIAAMAMQGMIAGLTKFRTEVGMEEIIVHRPKDVAQISAVYADELLKQLET